MIERKQCVVVGRLVSVSLLDGERYCLRMLLNHVRGPTSFTDFRFVNGVQCLSYHESTLLHGLLDVEDYVEMWIALDIM